MPRYSRRSLFCLPLLFVLSSVAAAPLPADQREASIRYVASLQNEDGGFRASAAPAPSALSNGPACLRALGHLGGQPRDRAAAERFVQKCYDPATGGFAATPGGEVSVGITASGLMCLAELKTVSGEQGRAITAYFTKNAKSVPEVYIAEAALYAAGLSSPAASEWASLYAGLRNPDGTYGKTVAETARAVCTLLRLGQELPDRAATVRTLRAAQRPDGAFSATGEASDLGTTYPTMRAFFMLKERPDLARLRAFVARCRNADGGYGVKPGEPSTAPGTYYASIVLHWAEELEK